MRIKVELQYDVDVEGEVLGWSVVTRPDRRHKSGQALYAAAVLELSSGDVRVVEVDGPLVSGVKVIKEAT